MNTQHSLSTGAPRIGRYAHAREGQAQTLVVDSRLASVRSAGRRRAAPPRRALGRRRGLQLGLHLLRGRAAPREKEGRDLFVNSFWQLLLLLIIVQAMPHNAH